MKGLHCIYNNKLSDPENLSQLSILQEVLHVSLFPTKIINIYLKMEASYEKPLGFSFIPHTFSLFLLLIK